MSNCNDSSRDRGRTTEENCHSNARNNSCAPNRSRGRSNDHRGCDSEIVGRRVNPADFVRSQRERLCYERCYGTVPQSFEGGRGVASAQQASPVFPRSVSDYIDARPQPNRASRRDQDVGACLCFERGYRTPLHPFDGDGRAVSTQPASPASARCATNYIDARPQSNRAFRRDHPPLDEVARLCFERAYRTPQQPFNPGESAASPQQDLPVAFQTSGRAVNFRQDVGEAFVTSGRPLALRRTLNLEPPNINLGGFPGRTPTGKGPGEAHAASGRPLDLGNVTQAVTQHLQPPNINLGGFQGRTLTAQPRETSGQPFDMPDVDLRIPAIQIQADSYADGSRQYSSTGQTSRRQDSWGVDLGQQGREYLQVPREQHENSGQPLAMENLQVPEQNEDSGRPMAGVQAAIQQTIGLGSWSLQQTSVENMSPSASEPQQMIVSSEPPQMTDPGVNEVPNISGPQVLPSLLPSQVQTASSSIQGQPLQQQPPVVPSPRTHRPSPQPAQLSQNFQNECRGRERPVCLQAIRQCPNLSQERLVQFLQNGDLGQILAGDPCSARSPLFNTLVKDTYHPGAIEDAVNGQIDFNRVAFDAVFDYGNIPAEIKPQDVPMSLLEAFELRIQFENEFRTNIKRLNEFCRREQRREADEGQGTATDEAEVPQVTPEELTFWIHRDELKMASAIDIELSSNIRDHPETDLTEALTCLFKAEKMNDFDQHVHLAEEAIRSVSPDKYEKAARKSTCSFKIDMHKDEASANQSYNPIEIVSYIGTTKPTE